MSNSMAVSAQDNAFLNFLFDSIQELIYATIYSPALLYIILILSVNTY